MHARAMIVACVLALATGIPAAQDLPRFSVVSIKPSADNGPGMKTEHRANGNYSVRKMTLSGLLAGAYDMPSSRIEGAPSWTWINPVATSPRSRRARTWA